MPMSKEDQKLREYARAESQRALRDGRLTRRDCEHCRSEKSEMHHPDYRKPLVVMWLCRKCHIREHQASGGWGVGDRAQRFSHQMRPLTLEESGAAWLALHAYREMKAQGRL